MFSADKSARLVELAVELTSTLDLDELLERIMRATSEVLDARSASLLLHEADDDTLRVAASTAEPGLIGHRLPATSGVAGECFTSGKPVVVHDAAADGRVSGGTRTESLLAVPLVARERAIGVLEAVNNADGWFEEEDVRGRGFRRPGRHRRRQRRPVRPLGRLGRDRPPVLPPGLTASRCFWRQLAAPSTAFCLRNESGGLGAVGERQRGPGVAGHMATCGPPSAPATRSCPTEHRARPRCSPDRRLGRP